MIWDFEGGRYWCPQCEEPFARLGDHVVEQLDRQVVVRVVAHCRRRYRRACGCRVPATVTAPGPPKAIASGEPTGYPGTGRGSPACRAPDNPGLLHPDQLASDHDPGAPAARAASLAEKEELLASIRRSSSPSPHYNGCPAVLVRLPRHRRCELAELITGAWRCQAPRALAADLGRPPR